MITDTLSAAANIPAGPITITQEGQRAPSIWTGCNNRLFKLEDTCEIVLSHPEPRVVSASEPGGLSTDEEDYISAGYSVYGDISIDPGQVEWIGSSGWRTHNYDPVIGVDYLGRVVVWDIGCPPSTSSTASQISSTIEDFLAQLEFNVLSKAWKEATWYVSSPNRIAEHPAYQAIIEKGESVLPMILRDLEKSHAQWFWALTSITNESPILLEDRGNIEAMTEAWLAWGKERQYI